MSSLGQTRPEEDVVLVFRPPENPAAQIAGVTPFKSLRLKLDELLDWFKGLNVDSIDLWIEGAYKSGNRTELFLSVEGKTGAKLTLRPYAKHGQVLLPPQRIEETSPMSPEPASKEAESRREKMAPELPAHPVTAFFSPGGGIERQIVSLIDSAITSIEMAAHDFTNVFIGKALVEAVKRGVKVSVVLDRTETIAKQAEVHDALEKAGADVRLISPPKGLMHDKYIIVDGSTVEWGSYNYTEPSETANYENAHFRHRQQTRSAVPF
jgi:phosphatidylserine/phosphatidylglycerophosphate/cardiolipin synthase-like enzyme